MPNANITKRALSGALKELLEDRPFEKISIAAICERCSMDRKSFYYHFKDKYDLINWICDTEFLGVIQQENHQTDWKLIEDLCSYLQENQAFYRRTLRVSGQNSLSEYLEEVISNIIAVDLEGTLNEVQKNRQPFFVSFYTDAFMCAIKRWILEDNDISAQEFTLLLKSCLMEVPQRLDQRQCGQA